MGGLWGDLGRSMVIASIIMMVFMMFIDHGDVVYDDGIGVHYNITYKDNEHNGAGHWLW